MADYGAREDRVMLAGFIVEPAGADAFTRWARAANAGCKKPGAALWLRVVELVARKGALAQSQPAKAEAA